VSETLISKEFGGKCMLAPKSLVIVTNALDPIADCDIVA
jgi:hypothetical protein